jgi:hypothetical protein
LSDVLGGGDADAIAILVQRELIERQIAFRRFCLGDPLDGKG